MVTMNKTKKLMVAGLVGLLGACDSENYNPYDNYDLESDSIEYASVLEFGDNPIAFVYQEPSGRAFSYNCYIDRDENGQGLREEYLGPGNIIEKRFDCSNLKNIIETKSGVNLDTYTHPTRDD